MLISREEVKTILQIGVNTYDSLIDTLIPLVQDFTLETTNNKFIVAEDLIYIKSANVAFISGTPAIIRVKDVDFLTADNPFVSNQHIIIQGSLYNDGFYQINQVLKTDLVLVSGDSLVDEDYSQIVNINVVQFPRGLKLVAAKLIGEDLKNNSVMQGEKVKQEQIGKTNTTFGGSTISGDYPEELLKLLKPYRRIIKV